MSDRLPEVEAASRVVELVAKYLPARDVLSDAFMQRIGGAVVAHRHVLRPIFDAVDADPRRLGDRGRVLRRDPVLEFDTLEAIDEELDLLQRELEAKRAMRDLIVSSRAGEYDPDDVAEAREDVKDRERRHDERANREAVRP